MKFFKSFIEWLLGKNLNSAGMDEKQALSKLDEFEESIGGLAKKTTTDALDTRVTALENQPAGGKTYLHKISFGIDDIAEGEQIVLEFYVINSKNQPYTTYSGLMSDLKFTIPLSHSDNISPWIFNLFEDTEEGADIVNAVYYSGGVTSKYWSTSSCDFAIEEDTVTEL